MLDSIRIVLVNTSHPGNIGSSARAMKTMGFSDLYLVAPLQFPHDKAVEMASGATDILDHAKVVATLDEAIADCTLVVGLSARDRAIPWPLHTPKEISQQILAHTAAPQGQVALLFGREQNGLSNEELQRCHCHVQIPANPIYSSLNLAAAVQVMTYELRMAQLGEITFKEQWDYRLATVDEMEKFFIHLQEVLVQIDFLKLSAPRRLMTRMRRLFFRTRPDAMEMNMLRGMLTSIQESIRK